VRSPVPGDDFPGQHSSRASAPHYLRCSTQAGALLGQHPGGSPSYPVNLAPLNPLFWSMPNRSVASPQTQILGGMSHTPSQSGTHPHLAQVSPPGWAFLHSLHSTALTRLRPCFRIDEIPTHYWVLCSKYLIALDTRCGSSKLRALTRSTTWQCAYAARFPLRFSDIVRFLGWVISNIHP
jgi:hypothetical protein